MADKIVVMHDGEVEQIGAPLDLYDTPRNLFVAGFIGSPAMNFLGRQDHRRILRDRRAGASLRARRQDAGARGAGGRLRHPPGASARARRRDRGRGRGGRADRARRCRSSPGSTARTSPRCCASGCSEAGRDRQARARCRRSCTSSTRRPATGSEPEREHRHYSRLGLKSARVTKGRKQDGYFKTRSSAHQRRPRGRRRRREASAAATPAFAQDLSFTPEDGAELRVLRWNKFVQGDEDQWKANTETFTAGDRRAGDARGGILGGHPAEGGGRRQYRLRPGHHFRLVRRSAPISRQARAADRPRRLSRQQIRRLVRRAEEIRHARRRMDRPAARRRRRAHGLPQDLGERGGLRGIPDRHAADPRMRQEAPRQRPSDGHGARPCGRRRQRLDAHHSLGLRRQDGRREQQGRHQQPGDDRGAGMGEGALPVFHPWHALLARLQQQQGVPRRRARRHQQRHLRLLRGARTRKTRR